MTELNFADFKMAIQAQFEVMASAELFVTDIDKDTLWDTYLGSFPDGTNNIFRERAEHDCQHCKQFIRACGDVVAIMDNCLISIWDIQIEGHYQVVADALSELVKSKLVKDVFLSGEKKLGTDFNHQLLKSGETLKWDHFYFELPNKFVKPGDSIGTLLSNFKSGKEVFQRGMTEITLDASKTVLELIDQNSLYRGEEHKAVVELFVTHKNKFDALPDDEKDNYCWVTALQLGGAARIRNTVIGTLLTDISEDTPLDQAVKMFESKVAPTNYKRPSAVITQSMIANAEKKVSERGIGESLLRRYAVVEDLTINNILFADRSVKKVMSVFDELTAEAPTNMKNLSKVEEVDIETFVNTILQKAETVELLLENEHSNNMMSLIAPQDKDAKNIFKWGNNFSWAYQGEVADSMRERVKAAGGRVDGVFRFTHSWNELEPNESLMDLHVFMPGNCHTDNKVGDRYGRGRRVGWNMRNDHYSGGIQDVDYTAQAPRGYVPIENITFPRLDKMPEGTYICKIHNWSHRKSGGRGKAEIEFGGNVFKYEYPATKNKEWITIAHVTLKNGQFSIEHKLNSTDFPVKTWGITSTQFHKVSMIMNSPNHWDGEQTGNKHYFFMLDGCKNDQPARGFFNEFLNEGLRDHRKVFEVLGSRMKTPVAENQLSGLGFSSTQRNSVFCKVTGNFTRTIKINF